MSELNPFAVNRAEYMRDLWKYYVPLKELDLETSKALVIEGGRGTGKSTVFLCNCWRNQLAAAENDPAKTIDSFLNKKSVGLYYKVDGAFLSAMDTNSRAFANRQEKAKQTYDLVLSNPPFGPLSKKKKKYRKAGNVFTTSKRYEAELLWANLKLMHTDSFLIIILPSTYMNGSSYIECRKWLARNYNIHAIVKLPSNTFEKATLNTVAIILQKVEPCATYVYNTATSVYQAHYDSKWSIKLSFSITLRRILDGTWDNNSYTLAEDQHLQIYRGNISSKYFSKTGDVILHCSSIFVNNSWMPGLRYCTGTKASQRKYLNHGDIVINRIGRCAGYWSVYTGMQKLISDCLIVVKEPSDATIEALRNHSENGRLQIPLRGVSTPYITIDDVRSLLLNN